MIKESIPADNSSHVAFCNSFFIRLNGALAAGRLNHLEFGKHAWLKKKKGKKRHANAERIAVCFQKHHPHLA